MAVFPSKATALASSSACRRMMPARILAEGEGASDLVVQQTVGRGEDEVQHVVEGRCKQVNVFAVERRDEGLVELDEDAVGHLVAAVLDLGDLGDGSGHLVVVVVIEQIRQDASAVGDVIGYVNEQVEELRFSRYKANHESVSWERRPKMTWCGQHNC